MFERILFKILQKYLGDYILGLDTANLQLGVWSGNIIIENVSLNSKLIELLNLPLNLIFSHIGRMKISIPWNKLSSTPVELLLEDLYLVLSLQRRDQWALVNNRTLIDKLTFIERVKEGFLSKIREKNKEISKGSSYFEKLTKLIIDNMQVTIRNIHLRLETNELLYEKSACCGILLESLVMTTTDSNWNKGFLDRTITKEKPINKLLSLVNLALYWSKQAFNTKELGSKEKIIDLLKEKARLKEFYLFSLNGQAKMTHNIGPLNPDIPETRLSFTFKPIDFIISKTQLQQALQLMEFFQAYKENSKKTIEIDSNKEKELKYQELFTKTQEKRLLEEDRLIYEDIIRNTNKETLQKWTKIALKEIQKQAFLQESLKTPNKGWLSWVFSPKADSDLLSFEERSEFFDFIEEIVKEESFKRDFTSINLELDLLLEGGSLYLKNNKNSSLEEGVRLGYKGLSFVMGISSKIKGITIKLDDFFIEMVSYREDSPVLCSFLTRNEGNKVKGCFIKALYEKENQELTITSCKIIYNPKLIEIVQDFFNLELKNPDLKESAIEKLHEIGDITQASIEEDLNRGKMSIRRRISVKLESPLIIIPFLHNNSLTNECWKLQSGDLYLFYDPNNLEKESLLYDIYELGLKQIKLEYYSSLGLLEKGLLYKEEDYSCLIEEFQINVLVKLHKGKEDFIEGKPKVTIDIELPLLQLNLSRKVYRKLLLLKEHLSLSMENTMEIAHNERIALLQKASKIGEVYKRISQIGITTWGKFFCVLSGNYLYFFVHQKDLNPHSNFYLKNARIEEGFDKIRSNILIFHSKHANLILSFEKPEQKLSWLSTFTKYFSQISRESISNSKQRNFSVRIKNFNLLKARLSFLIKNITLRLSEIKGNKEDILLLASELVVNSEIKESFLSTKAYLSTLVIKDQVFGEKDFLRHIPGVNERELLRLTILSLGYEHPDYKGVHLMSCLDLGRVRINYNEVSMGKILDFFVLRERNIINALKPSINKGLFPIVYSKGEEPLKESPILLKFNLYIPEISFVFMRLKEDKGFSNAFEVKLEKGMLEIEKSPFKLNIKSKLGNLQILDLISSENPFEVLGLEEGGSSLCEVEYQREKGLEGSLTISFNAIKVNLMLESLILIGGYIKTHVIQVIQRRNEGLIDPKGLYEKSHGPEVFFYN